MATKTTVNKQAKAPETAKNKPENCNHPGYSIIDGELRCVSCGQPSTKARLVDGVIVPIDPEVTCPECGCKFPFKKK